MPEGPTADRKPPAALRVFLTEKTAMIDNGQTGRGYKKAPLQGLNGGLWEIRTLDLFRVKEAL